MGGFRTLKVWQKSKDLAVYLYKLTAESPFNRDFGLRDQIRRAAVSIPSNIAEGDERDTNKESVRFLYIYGPKGMSIVMVRREFFNKVGGYDEHFDYGEDWALYRRW